jgi:hypothetical protein
VSADTPEALVELNVLSRDLSRRCQVLVDVTGAALDRRQAGSDALPQIRARRLDPAWQGAFRTYLGSAQAAVLARQRYDGLDRSGRAALDQWPLLASRHGYYVYAPTRATVHHEGGR